MKENSSKYQIISDYLNLLRKIIHLYTRSSLMQSEICSSITAIVFFSIADEPAMQGVRRAGGRFPLRRIHLRGLQGEFCHPILNFSLSFSKCH